MLRPPRKIRVLIACEFSGVVRRAFQKVSDKLDVYSCDLLPAEDNSKNHIQGDVTHYLNEGWSLMIAHPPCTRLCRSGVRWLHERDLWDELDIAANFFSLLLNSSIERTAIENPVMHKYAKQRIKNYRNYNQVIQPWQFGHNETKATCLWLKRLPPLRPTKRTTGRVSFIHSVPQSKNRWKIRSRTPTGIAKAMATQWLYLLLRE